MSLAPAQRLGPYEVLRAIGAGGMGEVWLARDTRLERQVALKLLPSRLTRDPERLALFRNEALALAALNHANIATIHGLEELPGGTMLLVLEYVEGESLGARLAREPLDVPDALQIGAQVAQALEVAHERGVVHRDLKPANIMLGPRGVVKVLDFGLAKRTHGLANAPAPRPEPGFAEPGPPGASQTGPVAGTPGYMSPEQVLAGTQDERTDVFAFACVLYECLTGRRAFPADDPFVAMAQVLNDAPDLSALPARTPASVRALLEAGFAKDVEARPREARELRHVLEDALGIRRAAALRAGEQVRTPHNLPAQATTFVGRERTLAEVTLALTESRLLTLTGMGGSGKTRLAIRLAEEQLERFPDGVWFVDLAPLTEPERLVEALAAALGVRDEAGRALLDSVADWLAPRRTLVLLDNAETHAQATAALVTRLLARCPELRLLVTDREPLGVAGETLYTVPSLGVPGARVRGAADALASEAVRLFADRARSAAPDFTVTDANASTVAEICRRLDGIPLALELAAARVRLLGVEQIKARLGDRFKLLTRAAGGAVARQQTVLAMIQWSWDHLLAPEQDLMRRLAVFTGGWTLERAAAVCSDSGDEFEVLDLLTRLAERALVVVQRGADGAVRYRFLESVWRFALERFEAHLEHEPLRERHLAVYLELAERAEQGMLGSDLERTLKDLAPEEENMIAAMAWCDHAVDGAVRGLRMASATNRMWSLLGRYAVGRRLVEEALARDRERTPTPIRSKALTRLAGFALVLGDYATARPHLEESLAASRAVGDLKGEARSLAGLTVVAMYQSRIEDALVIGEQSLAIYERLGEKRGVAMALHNLGSIEWALRRGDHGRARIEAALRLLRDVGDRVTTALCLATLTSTLVHLGEVEKAGDALRDCLTTLGELEAPRESIFVLEAAAEWLATRGRSEEAARLLGAATGLRTSMALPPMDIERAEAERVRRSLADALGEERVAGLVAEGSTLPRDQSVREAAAYVNAVPAL